MIGLDTGHLVYNYGTKLQAYAMQTLLSRTGEEVEIIQWHQKNYKILNGLTGLARKVKKIRNGYPSKYWKKINSRYKAIDSFNKRYNIHKFYGTFEEMKENTSIYSLAFCGSDQAWLPENVKKHWYTLEYCKENVFKASYAPSFGIETIPTVCVEKYKDYLSQFDSLSVREISGKKIIKDLLNIDVPVVLDPTLLSTREDWDKIKNDHKVMIPTDEKYIFCYFLGESKEHRDTVKEFSKKTGMKIINLPFFSKYCEADLEFADYDLYEVSPEDFIYLISNAEYVCTDSFHCTAFSIQYHKNFTVFHRFKKKDFNSTNTRLYSLLGQLGLEDNIITNEQELVVNEVNYVEVDKKLLNLRYDSAQYLDDALEKKNNV